jgi:hypothetical protein
LKNKIKIIILFLAISFIGCGSEFEILLDKNEKLTNGIYWVESEGTLNYINFDGTGRKTIYTSVSPTPFYADISLSGDKIYWADLGDISSVLYYEIKRVGFDGTDKELLYSNLESSGFGPLAIAIDTSSSSILWGYFKSGANHHDIWKSGVSNPLVPGKWVNTLNSYYMYSICVDSINRIIYYTANDYYEIDGFSRGSGNAGSVYYSTLDNPDTYHQITSLTGVPGDSVPLKGIAVDGAGEHVYYVTHTTHGTWPKNITRTDLFLLNPEVWIYQGVADIDKIALDLKHRKIYWTSESDKSIYRADLDAPDSNIEVFLTLTNTPTGIAIQP